MYNPIEYSSNYSERTGNLQFYSKDEATNFNADTSNTNSFQFLMYEAKLLEITEADEDNGNKNVNNCGAIKGLSNFWSHSICFPSIPKLNLQWTDQCVLFAAGADNTNAQSNNIIFTIKDSKIYLLVVISSARGKSRNYQNFLAKDLKDQ